MCAIKKVLLPVDASEPCISAVNSAKLFAESFGCEITILNVQDSFASEESGMALGTKIVEDVKSSLKYTSSKIVTKVAFGNPSEVILDICGNENFDMIIICTHGLGAAKRFLLGSVTNKIVKHSKVPVLVLR